MIILDTSFIVGYKIENDGHHEESAKIMGQIAKEIYGKPIISDYIFDETVTVIFGRSKKLSIASSVGNELLNSLEIIKIEDTVFNASWKFFIDQKNTKFSFTDCTTSVLMKEMGIKNIATFDGDFKNVRGIHVIR